MSDSRELSCCQTGKNVNRFAFSESSSLLLHSAVFRIYDYFLIVPGRQLFVIKLINMGKKVSETILVLDSSEDEKENDTGV